ncbi:MAG: T9SS type A sorting domain-containing protein, partial [bacterium]|nr:T9SS type A sorting domain-containing protein [bacterium]
AAARRTETGWPIELQARDVTQLTTAHLFAQIETPGSAILAVRSGDFLGAGNTLFLHRVDGAAADLCLGRLNRDNPSVSGSGVLAVLDVVTPSGERPDLRLRYELRNHVNGILAINEISDIEVQAIPERLSLGEPYPNPFNSATMFTLNLSASGPVTLRVFNVLGQEVGKAIERELPAGVHHVLWDARDGGGTALSTGVYFARLEAAGRTDIRKIVLLR